ncbi:hypothetical protein PPERSA_08548 [Pseudocohnilembus persalinus]|uniref:Nucleic acid-binding, OB-fold n=1 Tax=Pseudocohnilembus persalinus TaxID=266149 RepID=A0A0V0R6L7_PSEPJ|nr:hypothetical protein PPERSA_08548 [Pseudocohnilembus persalinus]|eukprot:KRX10145.1 hypothetical protein PPERSA_08548 [Pseudocohnilembus persalinus]
MIVASQNEMEEKHEQRAHLIIDDIETTYFSFIARIENNYEQGNSINVIFNDDTATLTACIYKKGDQFPYYWSEIQNTQNSLDKLYVRIVCSYNNYKGNSKYTIVQMGAITDFNEISRFKLEIILRHLQRTQGYINQNQNNMNSNQKQVQQQMPQQQQNIGNDPESQHAVYNIGDANTYKIV